MPEVKQRPYLYLTDTLARKVHQLAYIFERVLTAIGDVKSARLARADEDDAPGEGYVKQQVVPTGDERTGAIFVTPA